MGHGMVHESYELMKNCRGVDIQEAARILEEEGLVLSKISEIGKRHPAMKGTVRQVVERAGRRRRGASPDRWGSSRQGPIEVRSP